MAPAKHMTNTELWQELTTAQAEWDQLRADLEETGGHSGSPGESLYERMNEIETELGRRGLAIPITEDLNLPKRNAFGASNPRTKFGILWARQNGLCWLCGGGMVNSGDGRGYDASFDHVTPRSKGGTRHLSNLKLAHVKCNSERGSKTLQEYRLRA